MKRLDQYLKTIGLLLPTEQKEDILKELSENILSKVEDRESELGRPLTEAEQSVSLFRPTWVQFQVAAQVGMEIASLLILSILLVAGNWVVLVNTDGSPAGKILEILNFVNQVVFYGLLVGCVVSIVQLALKNRHLRRLNRTQT